MTPADRAKRARELADAASPGPWEPDEWVNCVRVAGSGASAGFPPRAGCIASLFDGEYIENPNKVYDAEFIAESRTLLPALADDVERLTEALREEARCVECGRHPIEHDDECAGILITKTSVREQILRERVAELESEDPSLIPELKADVERLTARVAELESLARELLELAEWMSGSGDFDVTDNWAAGRSLCNRARAVLRKAGP